MATYPSRQELVTAMRNPHLTYRVDELVGGHLEYIGSRVIQYSGGYTAVFPFHNKNFQKIAIRCWVADIDDAKKRSQEISAYLNKLDSPYFCKFEYLDNAIFVNGVLYPIVIMDWVEGKPLKDFINDNIETTPNLFQNLAESFKVMVSYFHQQNIAHGDLQHGNILVKPNGDLVVIDYDSMYVEPLEGMTDVIKGLPGYQHPKRYNNQFINLKLDYFSELVIYLSLKVFAERPYLWDKYYNTEDLLFSRQDFNTPSSSILISDLLYSNEPSIIDLTNKLKQQLSQINIQGLKPLEELIVDEIEVAKENISIKWDLTPTPISPLIPKEKSINNIISKF